MRIYYRREFILDVEVPHQGETRLWGIFLKTNRILVIFLHKTKFGADLGFDLKFKIFSKTKKVHGRFWTGHKV